MDWFVLLAVQGTLKSLNLIGQKKKKKVVLASTQEVFIFQCLLFGIQSLSPYKSTITKGWLKL